MAPPLPWQSSATIGADDEYVVVTSRLPLRRHRHIPLVMAATLRIVRELRRSEGLVGYTLKADLLRKTFWTVSAWRTRSDMERFVQSDAHRRAMAAIGPRMNGPRIDTSVERGAAIPPSWRNVARRLERP